MTQLERSYWPRLRGATYLNTPDRRKYAISSQTPQESSQPYCHAPFKFLRNIEPLTHRLHGIRGDGGCARGPKPPRTTPRYVPKGRLLWSYRAPERSIELASRSAAMKNCLLTGRVAECIILWPGLSRARASAVFKPAPGSTTCRRPPGDARAPSRECT